MIDETYADMLIEITKTSPSNIILSQDLFNMIDEEVLIYALGHFYISVKNVLPPFCPFYLDKSLKNETYFSMKNNEECDKLLLELNYRAKEKNESSR